MRISELAQRTGVTIASLKYYLRIGLLHPGESLSATRAEYDESHVERVRLVRTLAEVGRLSIERIGEVVQALDHPPASRHELMSTAHAVLRDGDDRPVSPDARRLVESVAPDCGGGHSPAALALGRAITIAQAGGWPVTKEVLQTWSSALRQVAEVDVVADLAEVTPGEALRYAVVGNVLTDPIVIALRRTQQERLSAERLGEPTSG